MALQYCTVASQKDDGTTPPLTKHTAALRHGLTPYAVARTEDQPTPRLRTLAPSPPKCTRHPRISLEDMFHFISAPSQRPLFTAEDVKWLITNSPSPSPLPRSISRPSKGQQGDEENEDDADRLLLPLRSGRGLYRARIARQRIDHIIQDGSRERVTVREIAQELDLNDGQVKDLMPNDGHRAGWIWEGDEAQVITRNGYDAILKAIYAQCDSSPLSRHGTAKQHRISIRSFDRIVQESNEIIISHAQGRQKEFHLNHLDSAPDVVYSDGYRSRVEERLCSLLLDVERPTMVETGNFPGNPLVGLVQTIGNALVTEGRLEGSFLDRTNVLEFIPSVYTSSKRQELQSKVSTGELEWITVQDLKDIYYIDASPATGTKDNQPATDDLVFFTDVAVSKNFIERTVEETCRALKAEGYATITVPTFNGSDPTTATVIKFIFDKVLHQRRSDGYVSLELIGDNVIGDEFKAKLSQRAIEQAQSQAQEAWGTGKDQPYRRANVLSPASLGAEALDPKVLRQLLVGKVEVGAEKAYHDKIQGLQREAHTSLAQFWAERVGKRFKIYYQGLDSVKDAKLKEELSTRLLEYMLDELIPGTLKRASSEKLVVGQTLQRHVEELQASLRQLKTEERPPAERLQALGEIVNSFLSTDKKGRRVELDPADRTRHLEDMLRGMQKDGNDARLFLTLVLILIARDGPGVVYATGKYAPRLMKQLQGRVDADRFAWLKSVKDQAKSGTIPEDMRAEAKTIASESWRDIASQASSS
ncbi:MAG: hypothetical protein M4579_003166 [Chaenotheca gracillima]|nr:MAG: hypothetical protein M4579_003166 [Chaenotheca gracillima]